MKTMDPAEMAKQVGAGLLSFPVTNHDLLTIRFWGTKVANSTRLYFMGTKLAPREPTQDPPKNTSF